MTSNSWAAVKAYVNQTTVYQGDPVKLTIEADHNADRPDITGLKKDFVIQSTGQRSSFSMVNGNSTYTKSWEIQLMPKGMGKHTIPAITVDGESTRPITVEVAQLTAEAVERNKEHVIVEATIDPGMVSPYVQQQIPYQIRLFTDETVRNGDLYPPNLENAVIEQISGDKQYSISRNGKSFDVLERNYVIMPEKSGKLVIPPALFKGKQFISSDNQQPRAGKIDDFFKDPFFNDPFFSSANGRSKPITNRSEQLEVDVQPVPAEFKGDHWLPAEELVVLDSWEKDLPTFKVGEPVMRTLSLNIKGLAGPQIPEYMVAEPGKMRVYPDQAKTDSRSDGSKIYGLREQSISYIPAEAGKVTIPELKIDWWNVLEKKQQTFVLPARTVEVMPGASGKTSLAPAQKRDAAASGEDDNKTAANEIEHSNEGNADSWSPAWLILPLLLIPVYFFYRYRNRKSVSKTKAGKEKQAIVENTAKPAQRQLLQTLKQSCENNDKSTTARALLQLAEAEWPEHPPKNLGSLADRLQQGGELVRELDRRLYAEDSVAWDGLALWQVFKDGLPVSMSASEKEAAIAELYPKRS